MAGRRATPDHRPRPDLAGPRSVGGCARGNRPPRRLSHRRSTHACGGRRARSVDPLRGDRRARRRIRMRQEHAGARAGGTARTALRRDPIARAAAHRGGLARPRPDRLSEPRQLAESAETRHRQRAGILPGHRIRPGRSGRPSRPVGSATRRRDDAAVPTLARRASARLPRSQPGRGSRGLDPRRARFIPRRVDPGPDRRSAPRPAAGARHGVPVHQSRSLRGPHARLSGLRHEQGSHRRVRADRRGVRSSRAPVHQGATRCGSRQCASRRAPT